MTVIGNHTTILIIIPILIAYSEHYVGYAFTSSLTINMYTIII